MTSLDHVADACSEASSSYTMYSACLREQIAEFTKLEIEADSLLAQPPTDRAQLNAAIAKWSSITARRAELSKEFRAIAAGLQLTSSKLEMQLLSKLGGVLPS